MSKPLSGLSAFSIILLLIYGLADLTMIKSCDVQWISGVLHSFNGTDGAISKMM